MTFRTVIISMFLFLLVFEMNAVDEAAVKKPILKIVESNYWYGKIIYTFNVNGSYTIVSTKGSKSGKNYSRVGHLDPNKLTQLIESLKAIKYFEVTDESIEKERKKLKINSRINVSDSTRYTITFHKNELKHTMSVGGALPAKIKAHPKVLGYPIQSKGLKQINTFKNLAFKSSKIKNK